MDKNRLKYIMAVNGDTQAKLAEEMGVSLSRLNAKINGYKGAEFSQTEIMFIIARYRLTKEETVRIFFTKEVSRKDTALFQVNAAE